MFGEHIVLESGGYMLCKESQDLNNVTTICAIGGKDPYNDTCNLGALYFAVSTHVGAQEVIQLNKSRALYT